ncbi:FxLD family lanthipeptide [Streptomyces sp. NPDC127098]|uniref:FxLD family lanthipeptide n=1 Tax=Streptomyces sp. NPDC127098 TaxID=3347137 RepID=UPI0036697138
MPDIHTSAGALAFAEPPEADELLDDEDFTLNVRVVVATYRNGNNQCSTNDGCGQTCENGASACNSSIDDPDHSH